MHGRGRRLMTPLLQHRHLFPYPTLLFLLYLPSYPVAAPSLSNSTFLDKRGVRGGGSPPYSSSQVYFSLLNTLSTNGGGFRWHFTSQIVRGRPPGPWAHKRSRSQG